MLRAPLRWIRRESLYITGFTVSPDFPTTLNSVSTTYLGGEDAFIVKMDPSGNLLYSSYPGWFRFRHCDQDSI